MVQVLGVVEVTGPRALYIISMYNIMTWLAFVSSDFRLNSNSGILQGVLYIWHQRPEHCLIL